MKTQQIQEKIVQKIIKQMETAGKNWTKPWNEIGGMPKNIRGTFYKGINTFILWSEMLDKGYKQRTFATFKQIQEKGGKVNKGEKGCQVVFWKPTEYKTGEKDDSGDDVYKKSLICKFYYVFNLDQTDLLEDDINPIVGEAEELPSVEEYIKNTGADIRIADSKYKNACYYVPSKDYIGMVSKDYFKSTKAGGSATANFYATLLHELTHWTGHESRLDRNYKAKYFDDVHKYAFEELVAELGSVLQTQMLGINSAPTEHAAQYLNIWLGRIKEKPDLFFKASAMAQKAVTYIQDLQKKDVKIESNQNMAKLFKNRYTPEKISA